MELFYLNNIAKILYEEDPVKLKSPNEDEYSNEAKILSIYIYNNKYEHILDTLHNVFISQFNWGEDDDGNLIYHDVVGGKSNFESSAKRICALLNGDK